jgi:MFS family permease
MKNGKWKMTNGRWLLAFAIFLLIGLAFRVYVAHWLPNDTPDDGRVYAQMARNVLEQHVYSHDSEAPVNPSLIRLPGYPLFLASIYSVFGHTNNGAVRFVQALIDTASCALIAVLAFYWQPDEKKKRVTALAALALAAVCPFTTIYTATILTEVLTNFLLVAVASVGDVRAGKIHHRGHRENQETAMDTQLGLVVCGGLGRRNRCHDAT